MGYWVIRWNAKLPRTGQRVSSRYFETFLCQNAPYDCFEAYGFQDRYADSFGQIQIDDLVFCYQSDKRKYVARCRVMDKLTDAPGGPCLVLGQFERANLREGAPRESVSELGMPDAEALCHRCGLPFIEEK